jgi:hypothetical protein
MSVDIMYNHKIRTEKRRAINVPSPEPRYHVNKRTKPRRMRNPSKKQTIHSSWLGPFPLLGVFLGRRSSELLASVLLQYVLEELTLVNVRQDTTLGDSNMTQ